MATAYLNRGATSFAAVNWSDSTGFAANAELVVSDGGSNVTSDVDYNATDIRFLKISENFSGNIGTAASPLYVDATDGTNAQWSTNAANEGRIEHGGTGSLFVRSSTGAIANLMQNGSGNTFLVNGTAVYTRVNAGRFTAETAATVTNCSVFGGSATIGATATAGTLLEVLGGSCVVNRPYTTINLYSGNLYLDIPDSGSSNITLNIYGGTATVVAITTSGTLNVNRYAGLFDPSRARKDITVATMYTARAARFTKLPTGGPKFDITNQYLLDSDAQRI